MEIVEGITWRDDRERQLFLHSICTNKFSRRVLPHHTFAEWNLYELRISNHLACQYKKQYEEASREATSRYSLEKSETSPFPSIEHRMPEVTPLLVRLAPFKYVYEVQTGESGLRVGGFSSESFQKVANQDRFCHY